MKFDNAKRDHKGVQYSGKINYFIEDHDGSFFGSKSTMIPSTVLAENTQECTENALSNGYKCLRTDLAVIEFENIASQDRTRITWPINISPRHQYEGVSIPPSETWRVQFSN